MDQDTVMVNTEITIGGDIPESMLNGFLTKLSQVYDTQGKKYIDHFTKMMKEEIKSLNNAPLTLKLQTVNGQVNDDFLFFCAFNSIKVHINTAPYIDVSGEYNNEALTILTSKLNTLEVVPLNGQGEPTAVVEDVFSVIDIIFDAYEQGSIEEAPLSINEPGIPGDIARRKLAGEPLRKILTDILKSRIGYTIPEVPPFKIIKGK